MLASWQIYLPQGGSPRRDGTQQASTFSICVGGALQFRFRVWWLLLLKCVCSQSRQFRSGDGHITFRTKDYTSRMKASLGWSRGCGGPLGGVYHCISNEKNGGKLWWDIGEIYNDINLENGYR